MSSQQPPPPRSIVHRTRERLACSECRRRKLKCDREYPCGACQRRGDGDACQFVRFHSGLDLEKERRVQAELRLIHLEELVRGFAETQSYHTGRRSHNPMPSQQSESTVRKDDLIDPTPFAGETHWSAMLDDIDELRLINGDSQSTPEQADPTGEHIERDDGVSILFGVGARASYPEILSRHLPSRKETDRMLASYFRSRAIAAPFIHSSTFGIQYEAFWGEIFSTSPLWTSILFSICHVASTTLKVAKPSAPPYDGSYATAAAGCLVAGNYFRGGKFGPESLLLFVQAQCVSNQTLSPEIGVLMSQAVRIATIAGYHREPSSGTCTPFQGEMRRRAWSLIVQLDLLINFNLGLPSNIQYPTWDTKPPLNLLDSDLNESMPILPPSRPDDFPSEIQFYNIKLKLMTIFEKILRHTLSTRKGDPDSAELSRLDKELSNAWNSLPPLYQPREMAGSVVDTPHVIVTRLCVACLYYKCVCVLHRPYVTHGRRESILLCYEAATNLVTSLLSAAEECKPGGQTETESWFMSSLTWHDLLLGSTALCLILCVTAAAGRRGDGTAVPEVDAPFTLDLLLRSRNLCLEHASARGSDTLRVASLLGNVISFFGGVARSDNPGSLPSLDNWTGTNSSAQEKGTGVLSDRNTEDASLILGNNTWEDLTMNGSLDDESWAFIRQYIDTSDEPKTG